MQPPAQRPAGGPLAPIALSGLFRLLAATWRVRFQGRGLLLEIMDRGPSVLAFWHGEQLAMIAAHQRLGILSMISRSRDGELVGRVVAGLGFGVVRGSSSRGGGEALQGCAAAMRARGAAVGLAVDGPRGPRWEPKAGAAVLAARLQCPIVFGVTRVRPALRLGSWDRFEIPAPFARIDVRYGVLEPPANAAEDIVEAQRRLGEGMREASLELLGER